MPLSSVVTPLPLVSIVEAMPCKAARRFFASSLLLLQGVGGGVAGRRRLDLGRR